MFVYPVINTHEAHKIFNSISDAVYVSQRLTHNAVEEVKALYVQ